MTDLKDILDQAFGDVLRPQTPGGISPPGFGDKDLAADYKYPAVVSMGDLLFARAWFDYVEARNDLMSTGRGDAPEPTKPPWKRRK